MKLKCRINEKDYDIVQGCTFTENFNETLDSAVICIDQIPEITNLVPYTDVYIWNADENFDGYYCVGDYLFFDALSSTTIISTSYINEIEWNSKNAPFINEQFWVSTLGIDGFLTLSGVWWDIWFDLFTSENGLTNTSECRYILNDFDDNTDLQNIKVAFLVKIEGVTLPKLGYGTIYIDSATSVGLVNVSLNVVEQDDLESSIANFEDFSIPCTYDIRNHTISLNSVPQNRVMYIYTEGGIEFRALKNITITKIFGDVGEVPLIYRNNNSEPTRAVDLQIYHYLSGKEGFSSSNRILTPNIDFSTLNNLTFAYKMMGKWYHSLPATVETTTDNAVTISVNMNLSNVNNLVATFNYSSALDKWELSFSNVLTDFTSEHVLGLIDEIVIDNLSVVADSYSPLPSFFKHMLIDSFKKTRIQLKDSYTNTEALFKYEINLFSETKKLEKVMLPNISITQSLVQEEKRSCWFYLEQYVNLYSPKYKKASSLTNKKWQYIQKYYVSRTSNSYLQQLNSHIVTNLKDVFDKVVCPEFSLTNPSLKDVLSQIMVAKDIIPIVFNDVIYGLDIGAINYENFNRSGTNFDVGNMDSSEYATDARREYGNALSQENSAHLIEYMGFRNPNGPFLTLEDMVLETRFPIYKINSIKMCYYKKFTLANLTTGEQINDKAYLCKYDITPLVLQNKVRNTLITNWEDYDDYTHDLTGTIEEKMAKVAQYKLCTVGYDIGSKTISGWGTTYNYLTGFLWFKGSKSYIENLINLLDSISEIGTEIYNSYLQTLDETNDDPGSYEIVIDLGGDSLSSIVSFADNANDENVPNKLKSIVFEVDYDAMYNGAIKHSKDYVADDDIETVDNCSAALTVLEADGLFEKEKMNRMSNMIYKTPARYDNDNGGAIFSRVQKLATYDELTDSIIYSREYQIFDNAILANYESTHEYVLKNYFTSVWAKYRTYSYMSYDESVKRAENFREFLLLSTSNQYYEEQKIIGSKNGFAPTFLSFLKPSDVSNIGIVTNDNQINCGYFEITDDNQTKKYLSDVNSFASGTSVCYNIAMVDNVSGGTYIDSMSANISWNTVFSDTEKANYKATQKWYPITSNLSDAFIPNIGIYFCHLDNKSYWKDGISTVSDVRANVQKFKNLPSLTGNVSSYQTISCGDNFVLNKDNKEVIDATFQFDYLVSNFNKDDILLSPWVSKLNDTIGVYKKFETDKQILTNVNIGTAVSFFVYQAIGGTPLGNMSTYLPKTVVFKIEDSELQLVMSALSNENPCSFINAELVNQFSGSTLWSNGSTIPTMYVLESVENKLVFNRIISASASKIKIAFSFSKFDKCTKTILWQQQSQYFSKSYPNEEFELSFVRTVEENDVTYHYFSGTLSYEYFRTIYEGDNVHRIGLETGYRGNSDVTALSTDNSLVSTVNIIASSNEYDTVDETNMVIILSTSPLKNSLVYNSYQLDEDNSCTLPTGMYFDTKGFNNVTTGHTVPEYFSVEGDVITVRASICNEAAHVYKSIQYYYKDDNNVLHFVFGVNIERNTSNKYDDFNIYLSNISKRNQTVYNDKHQPIGFNRNYQNIFASTVSYGEGQYYSLEKIKAPIFGEPWVEESASYLPVNFTVEANNPNLSSCYLLIKIDNQMLGSIIVPSGNFKIVVNPTHALEQNEIDLTSILESYVLKWYRVNLNSNVVAALADRNGEHENSDDSILLERRVWNGA